MIKIETEWAISQNKVSRVEAEIAPDNQPSMNVLAKVGFIPNVRNCVKNEIMKISEKQPQMSVISGLFFCLVIN